MTKKQTQSLVPLSILASGLMISVAIVIAFGSGSGVISNSSSDSNVNIGKQVPVFGQCLTEGKKEELVKADAAQGDELGVNGTPGFFINGVFLNGNFPYKLFKEVIDKQLSGNPSQNYKDYSLDLQEQYGNKNFNPVAKNVSLGSGAVLGDSGAPVTIVEFTDFQCPFCQAFFQKTLPTLKSDYIDTGKVKLVIRNYPLIGLHPNAEKSSQAAECAKDQNKFWQFHDLLFKKQNTWASLDSEAASLYFMKLAKEVGLK